eukprot:m.97137 g.97137  ORF g.97137 m.97137 type:complete len:429 (-) comp13582_c0_seq5:1657-2943(-)
MDIKQIFDQISNEENILTLSGLRDLLGNGFNQTLSDEELQTIFNQMDQNGDGKVTFDEFCTLAEVLPQLHLGAQGNESCPSEAEDDLENRELIDDVKPEIDEPKEDAIMANELAKLEKELREARLSEATTRETLKEQYATYEKDVAELEAQLADQDEVMRELRAQNTRLRDLAQKSEEEEISSGAFLSINSVSPVSDARSSPSADRQDDMLQELRQERNELLKAQEQLEDTIANLKRDHDAESRMLTSRMRAAESAFENLQQEAEVMQLQLSEMEELKRRNAELTDALDEQMSRAEYRQDSGQDKPETEKDRQHSGKQSNAGLREVTLELELDQKRTELAMLKARVSTFDAKNKGLQHELDQTNLANTELAAQVEALGLALSKMKTVVDRKERTLSPQRSGTASFMKRLSKALLVRGAEKAEKTENAT